MTRLSGAVVVRGSQPLTLLSFWRYTLKSGALPFLWEDPVDGSELTLMFERAPELTPLGGGVWRIAFTLLSKPQLYGNDSYTKALLLFRGADASTDIYDSNYGGSEHVWTAAGNAQIDADGGPFGDGALLLDGTGDHVSTPDHADFTLGSGNWAVDFRFNCAATSGSFENICGQVDSSNTNTTRSLIVFRANTNVIAATVRTASDIDLVGATQFTDAVNTGWHHCAVVRDGNTLRLFIDGVQEASAAISGAVNDSSNAWAVGTIGEVASNPWTSRIAQFRLSGASRLVNGVFPVPTRPYEG
jgi:hypothetical protein